MLKTAAPLDHESSPGYVVRVAASDRAGHRDVRVFSIAVADANPAGVDGIIGGIHAESSSRLGPFQDSNGNLYFLSEVQVDPPNPAMRKSTDGGGTWTEVDAANRPEGPLWYDLESVWMEPDGSTLRILRQRSSTIRGNNVAYYELNMSDAAAGPDTWGLRSRRSSLAAADDAEPDDQAASLAVRSNGDLYTFTGRRRRTRTIASRTRRSPPGGSWGRGDHRGWCRRRQVHAGPGDRRGRRPDQHLLQRTTTNNAIEHRNSCTLDVLASAQEGERRANDDLVPRWRFPPSTWT